MDADRDLMVRIQAGDRRAFESLYSRYGPPVMRFLYRLCADRVFAEDLTQDVFLKVWRAAAGWRPIPGARLSTWLFQIAKHHGWNEIAKRSRRAHVRGSPLTSDAVARAADHGAEGPGERLARAEWAQRVDAALQGLSPKLRLVFVLVRIEGLPFAEAASIAGIPVGTVKSRAAAAEVALRRLLRPEA
ncbi:MAG: sigma-70 family RNA polymerase sigma factor [Planctomycetota bacterium]|nr:sigma-70 family RNA polymerase sigma factor [Planctomycetota bacterium]